MITSMLFFPEKKFYEKPDDYGVDWEDAEINTSDGVKLHGWYLTHSKREPIGTLLFFHGNAGNISGRLYKAKGWIDRGFAVLLIDYRGYGMSEGEIKHEDDLVRDAEASLKWLKDKKKVNPENLVIYGESLGSYVAIQTAATHRVSSLILEAPFTSFVDLARKHYPMIPAVEILLKDFRFENLKYIDQVHAPTFILHGTRDETCPYEMSGTLFDKASEPKTFLTIPNGAHNDLPAIAGEDYWDKPCEFVHKYLLG